MHKFVYPVILPADPVNPMEAATKQYVDDNAGGGGVAHPVRETTTFTTASLPVNSIESGEIVLDRGYRLMKITTNIPARVRLYTTVDKRNADTGRLIGTAIDQTTDHGLIFEFITSASLLSADLSPTVDGFDSDTDGLIPCAITNLSASAGSVSVTFVWIVTET